MKHLLFGLTLISSLLLFAPLSYAGGGLVSFSVDADNSYTPREIGKPFKFTIHALSSDGTSPCRNCPIQIKFKNPQPDDYVQQSSVNTDGGGQVYASIISHYPGVRYIYAELTLENGSTYVSSVTTAYYDIETHKQPISWKTNTITLNADDFYIVASGKEFRPNNSLVLHDSIVDNKYALLESTWFQDGIEMRMNIYIQKDANNLWKINELRTYRGYMPGDWIFYTTTDANGNAISHFQNETYTGQVLNLRTYYPIISGLVHFENIRLHPFIPNKPSSKPTAKPVVKPTLNPTLIATPPAVPTETSSTLTPSPTVVDMDKKISQLESKLDETNKRQERTEGTLQKVLSWLRSHFFFGK